MKISRLQMAKEALKDFKKFKSSKKCRHYNNIINFLKTVPSGFNDKNKINEFKDFLPIEIRRGIKLEKVVELVLQFYVGYSQAMKSRDVRRYIQKIRSQKHYAKNKKKILVYSKKYYEENKEKKLSLQKKYYEENKEKFKILNQEYYEKNKKKIQKYRQKYRQNNKDKIKFLAKKYYEENKERYKERDRFYSINKRRMSKGLDPIL